MARRRQPQPLPEATRVHAAELVGGPDGFVEWGAELTDEQAVARRLEGLEIVARGQNARARARAIESTVGPVVESPPHERSAGPRALPHFHQYSRSPAGHAFYETRGVRARRKR
jgi:hypothetical protein